MKQHTLNKSNYELNMKSLVYFYDLTIFFFNVHYRRIFYYT